MDWDLAETKTPNMEEHRMLHAKNREREPAGLKQNLVGWLLCGLLWFPFGAGATAVQTYVLDEFSGGPVGWFDWDPGSVSVTIAETATDPFAYNFQVEANANVGWNIELLSFGFALQDPGEILSFAIQSVQPDSEWRTLGASDFGEFGTADLTVKKRWSLSGGAPATSVSFDLSTVNGLNLATLEGGDYLFAAKTQIGSKLLWWTVPLGKTTVAGDAEGLSEVAAPLPAPFWMFGSALIGFVMLSNRRRRS